MENCMTCKHMVFDEKWGEYKCSVRKTRMYILLDKSECPGYEKYEKKKEKE